MNNNPATTSILILGIVAITALSGCNGSLGDLFAIVTPSQHILVDRQIAGKSVEDRPIEYLVLGNGSDVTLIMAAIHGDEPAGPPLVLQLAEHLQKNPQLLQNRTVVIIPVANPDGLARNSRHNANGIDLNRNFATANRTNNPQYGHNPLSEPEARVIQHLINQYAPDKIVSVHQPYGCVDYDGPAETIATRMAKHCNLPICKLGAQPGSLGSYAGIELGIPIVTLELPENHGLEPQHLWAQYGNALIAAILDPDTID